MSLCISVRMMGVGGPEFLSPEDQNFSEHEQMVFTKAISIAESFGKKVSLLVVPAGDIFAALAQRANSLQVDSVISGLSTKMTAEDQAFHMGQAWEALPEPKRQFNFYIVAPGGEAKVFFIGPHAPALRPDDVQLVHRLWVNMRRDPSIPTCITATSSPMLSPAWPASMRATSRRSCVICAIIRPLMSRFISAWEDMICRA